MDYKKHKEYRVSESQINASEFRVSFPLRVKLWQKEEHKIYRQKYSKNSEGGEAAAGHSIRNALEIPVADNLRREVGIKVKRGDK